MGKGDGGGEGDVPSVLIILWMMHLEVGHQQPHEDGQRKKGGPVKPVPRARAGEGSAKLASEPRANFRENLLYCPRPHIVNNTITHTHRRGRAYVFALVPRLRPDSLVLTPQKKTAQNHPHCLRLSADTQGRCMWAERPGR